MRTEVFAVQPLGAGLYQSVFPEQQAEFSQCHTTVQDACEYIKEVAGEVVIEIPEELK